MKKRTATKKARTTTIRLRLPLSRFAKAMELKLRDNDHKGRRGWRGFSKKEFTRRIMEEVVELAKADNPYSAMLECCDIANFAMMIFDNIVEDNVAKSLQESIDENGLLNPIVVGRLGPDRYELFDGYSRLG
ncbi:MAG: ParB/Srx family N-terminal domain-containing protein, partial [bacterium]